VHSIPKSYKIPTLYLTKTSLRVIHPIGIGSREPGREFAVFMGFVHIALEGLALLLLIPYVGWGVHLLRLRLRYHEEINPTIEVFTLLGVVVLLSFEFKVFGFWLRDLPVAHIFTILGLLVSAVALYGQSAVSLISMALVDLIMPTGPSSDSEPRFGPAEALERQGDYQGAVQEYMVIARLFPRDPRPPLRIADNLVKVGRSEEAARWFERALKRLTSPGKSLPVVNRLAEIYLRQLNRPEDAVRVLEAYLSRYPDAEYADAVRTRLTAIAQAGVS
jgi:tetratricopeptide repeat protein